MKRILLLVILLILYGSFYPWQFRTRDLPAGPIWILLHSWPDRFDRFMGRDMVVNFVLYIPFGVFCFLSIVESRPRALRLIATVLAAALLSACIEMAQLFDVTRQCSLLDVTCNTSGAAIGAVVAATFPAAISEVVYEAGALGAFRLSGAMALLYLWAGYQLFPFSPSFSQTALRSKLALLLSPEAWLAQGVFESLAGWLAISSLVEYLFRPRRIGPILAIMLLALPLKLFIERRTMTGSEVVGAILAIGSWVIFRKRARPMLCAGLLALAALVAAGLSPFHLMVVPQRFTWVPFLPMLKSSWESAFLILLQKSFLYGSAVWLLNENERGWMISSLMVAVPLAAVEGIQVFLPGRTPEVTDPLLALMLGLGLMFLERHAQDSRSDLKTNAKFTC